MVKGISDVDLVVFMDELAMEPVDKVGRIRYQEQLDEVLKQLKANVKKLSGVTNIKLKQYLLSFTIQVQGRWSVDVDLVPTADNRSSFSGKLIVQQGKLAT